MIGALQSEYAFAFNGDDQGVDFATADGMQGFFGDREPVLEFLKALVSCSLVAGA